MKATDKVTDDVVDRAFQFLGLAARECDKAVIRMMGGTVEVLEDMMVGHWGVKPKIAKQAMLAAIRQVREEQK